MLNKCTSSVTIEPLQQCKVDRRTEEFKGKFVLTWKDSLGQNWKQHSLNVPSCELQLN